MYDAVATALPTAQAGRNRKKALLVISDGNDTNSSTRCEFVAAADPRERSARVRARRRRHRRARRRRRHAAAGRSFRSQLPVSVPGGSGASGRVPTDRRRRRRTSWPRSPGERVNADALRQITDDTGGRTEIVRGFDGLDARRPASPTN